MDRAKVAAELPANVSHALGTHGSVVCPDELPISLSQARPKRLDVVDPAERSPHVRVGADVRVWLKVGKLVFGAYDEKAGMCGSLGDLVRHPRLKSPRRSAKRG